MTKPIISTLLAALAITMSANFAQADQTPTDSPTNQVSATPQTIGQPDGKNEPDRMKMVEKHLEHVKKILQITPEQEPTWQAYTTKVTTKVKMMITERNHMRQERSDASITTPERMEDIAKSLQRRAEEMSEMANVTKTLYAKLTPAQRIQFDNIAQQETKKYHEMMQHNMTNHPAVTPSMDASPSAVPATK